MLKSGFSSVCNRNAIRGQKSRSPLEINACLRYQLEHITSKGHSKASYLTKSKERTRENVEVEDICFKEEAIFREFVICLRKHQLAIQFVFLSLTASIT